MPVANVVKLYHLIYTTTGIISFKILWKYGDNCRNFKTLMPVANVV